MIERLITEESEEGHSGVVWGLIAWVCDGVKALVDLCNLRYVGVESTIDGEKTDGRWEMLTDVGRINKAIAGF